MTLDPQAQVLLDQLSTLGFRPFEEVTPAEARAMMDAMAAVRGEPPSLAAVADRVIPGPGGDLPVRVYRPTEEERLPVLVFFHGGGWVIGSIETHDNTCRALAQGSGCMVVSVGYRLAPEHKFPAAVEDAYAATAWVAAHGEELGADPARLGVGGDSAGGNLAAAVCLMAKDRGGPPIAFQLLVYPVTDCNLDTPSYRENAQGYLLTREGMRWFWGHYLRTEADAASPYASPLRAPDLAGLPPALVITAEYDPLRDEGEAYANRLREAGVPVTLSRYEGMIHGFFSLTEFLDRARDAVAEACAALRAGLGAARTP